MTKTFGSIALVWIVGATIAYAAGRVEACPSCPVYGGYYPNSYRYSSLYQSDWSLYRRSSSVRGTGTIQPYAGDDTEVLRQRVVVPLDQFLQPGVPSPLTAAELGREAAIVPPTVNVPSALERRVGPAASPLRPGPTTAEPAAPAVVPPATAPTAAPPVEAPPADEQDPFGDGTN